MTPPSAPRTPTGPDHAPSPLVPVPGLSSPDRLLPPLAPGTHQPPPPDRSHFAPSPQMGGPLVVIPSGGTTVATDGMLAAIARTAEVADMLARAVRAVRRAELVPHAPPLIALGLALHAGSATATHLADALREAVVRYSDAENAAWTAFDRAATLGGAVLGELDGVGLRLDALLLGALLLAGGPLAIAGGAAIVGELRAAIATAGSRGPGGSGWGVGGFLMAHPRLTGNPRFVALVRGVADGLGEAGLAAAGVPSTLALAVGPTGRAGVAASADGLMSAGPTLGLLAESPVDVRRVDRQAVPAPPVGATERLERVPEGDQVRIERYSAPGRADRFVVYVGPTETFDPRPRGEPWDLASNVGGVGGEAVGAIRATELAMGDAGITSRSPVQLVGFSQGGMVAARLAGDGRWNAVGLQTFGAPTGNVALPDGVQGMAVRNAEDFVPALAGPQTDHHLLQVERTAYADPARMPADQAAPGHQRVAYAATAAAIDAARSSEVRAQNDALDAFTADATGEPGSSITASLYHATRRDGAG